MNKGKVIEWSERMIREEEIQKLFESLGGRMVGIFPEIDVPVFKTPKGVLYLKEPGVVMLSRPAVHLEGIKGFLDGFDKELGFEDYLKDPVVLHPGTQLLKVAGQVCYMSFGPKRTMNDRADQYMLNLKSKGDGSVFEHGNITCLFYGESRSLTHELVRHRAGFGYSQLSQRYVGGKLLRFVERPEYQDDEVLHQRFISWIERAAQEYEERTNLLLERQKAGVEILSAEAKTDLRKKVQQASRSVLPNETEAPIVVTANIRAWRHFCEMRASEFAEIEIRRLAFRVFLCMAIAEPILFDDYEIKKLGDGTFVVNTTYRKV